jgi:integrase
MGLYKRGGVWWYQFKFCGRKIRESSRSSSKNIARDAERSRRRELEMSFNKITERKGPPLFNAAAKEWLAEKDGLAAKSKKGYKERLVPVNATFGKCLITDVNLTAVVQYRSARLKEGVSNRTVNYEVACIRGVLKRYGLWSPIGERIKKLRENHDAGRAISPEDEAKILEACRASVSPSLLPLFIFARDTGLRAAEIKALRRCDLRLQWKDGVIVAGEVIVPKSKTKAGTGRAVPFSPDVCSTLTMWLSRFAGAGPTAYVFPRHEVQMLKRGKGSVIKNAVLNEPVQSWAHAWRTAMKAAGLTYRFHDTRHSLITRLAENPAVSEGTIRAIAGHVSKQMLERYSHIRTQAKQDAIAALHSGRISSEGTQRGTQSETKSGEKKHATN